MSTARPQTLDEMTTSEKLQLLEELWENLRRTPDDIPAPEWHADVLHTREQRIQDGTAEFVDWSDAKNRIRNSVK